jgi:hypothetical protein
MCRRWQNAATKPRGVEAEPTEHLEHGLVVHAFKNGPGNGVADVTYHESPLGWLQA